MDYFFGGVTVARVFSLVLFFSFQVGERVCGGGEGNVAQVRVLRVLNLETAASEGRRGRVDIMIGCSGGKGA